jgi:hypothetical protein
MCKKNSGLGLNEYGPAPIQQCNGRCNQPVGVANGRLGEAALLSSATTRVVCRAAADDLCPSKRGR